MRYLLLCLLGLFLVGTATAQSPGDTIKVVVPEDKNCGDFVSQQDAQGWYDAINLITGQPDAHALDADGDGQPCESLKWGKVEQLIEGYVVRYKLVPSQFECEIVQEPFTISDLREQAVLAASDSVAYRGPSGVWPRWECVHTVSQIVSQE